MVKNYDGIYILKNMAPDVRPIFVSKGLFSTPYQGVYNCSLCEQSKESLDKYYKRISRMVSW